MRTKRPHAPGTSAADKQPENDYVIQYYTHHYPHRESVRFMSRGGNRHALLRREIWFRVRNRHGELVYLGRRHVLGSTSLIHHLRNAKAEVIDIGPVCTHPMVHLKRKRECEYPLRGRELTFDVDLTDYDAVGKRLCCSGRKLCHNCWKLVVIAAQCLIRLITHHLNLQHYLIVFSGSRGIHVWVLDDSAFSYTTKQRERILSILDTKAFETWFLQRVLTTQRVQDLMRSQAFLAGSTKFEFVKRFHPVIADRLLSIWTQHPNRSVDKCFADVREAMRVYARTLDQRLPGWKDYDTMLLDLFKPVLDRNVTTLLPHLVKSPFSVHPKTKAICVPLSFDMLQRFDPQQPLTAKDVCENPTLQEDYVALFSNFLRDLTLKNTTAIAL